MLARCWTADGCTPGVRTPHHEELFASRAAGDRNVGGGYVTALKWGDIEDGAVYTITFELDGQSFDGEAIGIYLNGVRGADIAFSNPDFLFDLAQRQTMTLYSDGTTVMAIDLAGSYAGLEATIACQEAQG